MRNWIIPILIAVTIAAVFSFISFKWEKEKEIYHEEIRTCESIGNLSITIIYDNNPYKQGLRTAWGFSCLIRYGKSILFDTGGDGSILLENMRRLNINPDEIEVVFLSHIHGDHVGGLIDFLKVNGDVTVYLPKSFPEDFKKRIRRFCAEVVEVEGPARIYDDVYSTGEMGEFLKEQALVIRTERGLIIVTGCAHPGIVKIVKKARDMLKDDVLLVIGGFHLIGRSEDDIRSIISDLKRLGVKYVAPCHCSGDLARKLFKDSYGKNFIDSGVGRVIYIRDLKK